MKSDQQGVNNIPFFEWTEREDGSGVATYNFGRHPVLVSIESATQAAHLASVIENELAERDARIAQLEQFENEIVAILPGSQYMDPPDGGDVPVAEQLRRYIADLKQPSGAQGQPVMKYTNSATGYHIEWEMLPYGTHLLYAHPAPAQQPAVPKGWRETVTALRDALIKATTQPVCCEQPVADDHAAGLMCCGEPEPEWPDEMVELFQRADALLSAQETGIALTEDRIKAVREAALNEAAAICDQEGAEWDSDAVQTYKNYAACAAQRIRALRAQAADGEAK